MDTIEIKAQAFDIIKDKLIKWTRIGENEYEQLSISNDEIAGFCKGICALAGKIQFLAIKEERERKKREVDIVFCKECQYRDRLECSFSPDDWFCKDGKRKE